LASPLLAHAWGPDSDTRPAQDIVDAKVGEAGELVAATRRTWQDLLDRIDTTFPALQDHGIVVSWKRELKAPLEEIFAGLAFSSVLRRLNDIHARVLRSRVFIALHMHAGDGNVHTNIPVNSDDYGMLQEANAAVAAHRRWRATWRRDLRRARHRHHQARIPDRRRARAVRAVQGGDRSAGRFNRGKLLRDAALPRTFRARTRRAFR
jgi:FAD/FMN-containing dehydrogenase